LAIKPKDKKDSKEIDKDRQGPGTTFNGRANPLLSAEPFPALITFHRSSHILLCWPQLTES
jgi:hypothetical protein